MKRLTAIEAAQQLGIRQVNYVYLLLRRGVLRGQRDPSGQWRVDPVSVQEYLVRRAERAKPTMGHSQAARQRLKDRFA